MNVKYHIFALSLLASLSGCTVVGSSEPICNGDYVTGVCTNSSSALDVIQNDNVDEYVRKNTGQDISEEEYITSPRMQSYDSVVPAVPVANTMTRPLYEPKPVLVQPKVMYVVINAWESESGVLNFQSTHLIDITDRSWSFGLRDAVKVKGTAPFSVNK